MKRIIFCLAVLFMLTLSGADRTILLNSFNKDDIMRWFPREGVKAESAHVWPDGVPGYNCKLTFFKYETGKEAWPAILLLGNHIPYKDWRNAAYITFDAYASEAGNFSIQVRTPHWWSFSVNLKEGRNRILQKIEDRQLNNVTQIHLLKEKPSKNWTVNIGPISLIEPDLDGQKKRFADELRMFHKEDFNLLTSKEREKPQLLLAQSYQKLNSMKTPVEDCVFLRNALEKLRQKKQENEILRKYHSHDLISLWCNSLEKVRRENHYFLEHPSEKIQLDAARGEGEGCQVAVLSKKNLKDVSIRLKQVPKNSSGHEIPASALSINPVGYVNCGISKSREDWWPDPILIYTDKTNLDAGKWQPWYLDVTVPRNQEPGLYNGTVEITANSIPMHEMPFQIKVRNFELEPGVPYFMATSCGVFHDKVVLFNKKLKNADARRHWKYAFFDLFLIHRINPDEIYGNPQSAEEVKYKLERGAGAFNIHHLDEYNIKNVPNRITGMNRLLTTYKKAGIATDKIYCYGWDERGPDQFQKINDVAAGIKAGVPIKFATTSTDETFGLNSPLKDIDMFIPGIVTYENNWDKIKEARKKGKKIAWYICVGPQAPYPNFFIEYPLLDARLLMGAMYWKYQPDGFLYWALGRFVKYYKEQGKWKQKPAEDWMKGAPLTNWDPNSFNGVNGDGALCYPSETGPVPTIRLKSIRDGLEDYMYFKKLADALNDAKTGTKVMSETWCKEAEETLKIKESFIKSLSEHTQNPADLFKQRQKIANLLEDYNR